MAARRKQEAPGPAIPHPAGKVTAANYDALAKAWAATHKPKVSEAICRSWRGARGADRETPERWCAWLTFLRQIGVAADMAVERGVLMVPAPWPWDFSVDAGPIEGYLSALLKAYVSEREKSRGDRPVSEDGRQQPRQADLEAIRESRRAADQAERIAAEARAKVLGDERRVFDQIWRRQSFKDRGIEPPLNNNGEVEMSFEMMIKLGWTIGASPGGTTVMMRPSARIKDGERM